MNRQVVSIGLLASYIRELVESDDFLNDLWVEGEVAEAFAARSGHVYFTLRDDESRLKCVIFRAQAQRLRGLPRPGEQIAAHGRISVYERDGAYQLYVDFVQAAGQGILALQLELLRQQLTLEGLFEPSRKRPIPRMPTTIGVVTSADGAVWHDIQQVLRRRYPLLQLVLAATPVQGDQAPAGIVAALEALQADGRAEVILVARGGGSAEDLWCFNDERVVRAVFACRVPVVSGVGHETDWTLIDEVADLRAPTPSAAAELCSPSILDLSARLGEAQRRADRAMVARLDESRAELAVLRHGLEPHAPTTLFHAKRGQIADLRQTLLWERAQQLGNLRAAVGLQAGGLSFALQRGQERRQRSLELAQARLGALDPAAVLRRGYAHVTSGTDGRPIGTVAELNRQDSISIRFVDGVATGTVDGVAPRTLNVPGDRRG